MPGLNRAPRERSARARREAGIDPVCHTLFGAALARSGLARGTAWGAAALVVGANLPDIDALAYFAGPAVDLAWRRGWSHGVLALALLPFVLTGSLLLVDRTRRRARGTEAPTAVPRRILFLSFIAILSHPILDTLNTYGVRWLMPFSSRWFYGDALFIVDPWVWLTLAVGVLWSWRRRGRDRDSRDFPARLALSFVLSYMILMWVSGAVARSIIARDTTRIFGGPVTQVMAGPQPITPLTRSFVLQQGSVYRAGTFHWLSQPKIDVTSLRSYPRGRPAHPAMAVAESSQVMRRFLSWARYPTFQVRQVSPGSYLVDAVDLRYARDAGSDFGSLTVPVMLMQSGEASKPD